MICDECYVYLNYTARNFSVGSLTEFRDRFLVVGSLSKTYAMTGWRLGYTLGPAAVVGAIAKLQSQSTSSSNAVTQKAALAAVTGPQDCVQQMRTDYIKLRDRIIQLLAQIPGITCNVPDGAFYVYPNVSAFFGRGGVRSAAEIAKRLLHEAHVVTVPGVEYPEVPG